MASFRRLAGVRVAILLSNGFEQAELTYPREALHAAGATTALISPHVPVVWGWKRDERDGAFKVELDLADAKPVDFDGVLLPGGLRNADTLRLNNKAVLFVHAMQIARKPIAAISHAPWVLVETDFVRARKLTSSPSLRTDIVNAGGNWVDQAVVSDELLVTGRGAADTSRFADAVVALFARGQGAVAEAS